MLRPSPLHERTSALCSSLAWKEWAGYAAVCSYDRHSEREYFAFRHTAGLIDVSPLYKYEVTGPDAAAFLARVWSRDIRRLPVGRVVYGCMCDLGGHVLDDGTVACVAPQTYRVTCSEAWLGWFDEHSHGFDVSIEDSTDRLAALSLQGPLARDILAPVVDTDLESLRFFGVRSTQLAGRPGWISRRGYTGDLGYELWVANEDACTLWDAVLEAGQSRGIEPAGLDAMDVTRIEAGFVLQGVDYVSARSCITEARKSTPGDAGLGWTVKLDREGWIGREALVAEQARGGSEWQLVGLELSWPEIEALYEEYGLPPHLAPIACRNSVPIYDATGSQQIGQATSSTWSPTLKRSLALAQVRSRYAAEGTKLKIEQTPEFERRQVTATVVARPFFDPPRKSFTPARAKGSS